MATETASHALDVPAPGSNGHKPIQSTIPAKNLSGMTLAPGKWGNQNNFYEELLRGSGKAEEWLARTRFNSERDIKRLKSTFMNWMRWKIGRIDYLQAEWVEATAMISLKGQGRKEAVEIIVAQREYDKQKGNASFLANALSRKESNEGKEPGG